MSVLTCLFHRTNIPRRRYPNGMETNMSKDYHGIGEQDAANGKYDPPHSSWVSTVNETVDSSLHEQNHADREAYEAGRDNANSQKK